MALVSPSLFMLLTYTQVARLVQQALRPLCYFGSPILGLGLCVKYNLISVSTIMTVTINLVLKIYTYNYVCGDIQYFLLAS